MFQKEVRFIEEVKRGKRILNPVVYFILAWVIYILSAIIQMVIQDDIVFKITGTTAEKSPFLSIATMLFCFAVTAVMTMLFVRFAEGRKITSLGLYAKDWAKCLFKGAFWGILAISAAMGILALMGFVSVDKPATQPIGFSAIIPLVVLFIGFIVQSGTEEIVSRGWLFGVVSARYNKIIGIIVSTIYFGSTHIFNEGFNFMVVVPIVLFSVFLCLYVIRTDNLWSAVGFHGAWNYAIGNIYGLDVSGQKIGAGSLVDLKVQGNSLFTGGTFGIEAGIPVILVLIIAIIVIVFIEYKYPKKAVTE